MGIPGIMCLPFFIMFLASFQPTKKALLSRSACSAVAEMSDSNLFLLLLRLHVNLTLVESFFTLASLYTLIFLGLMTFALIALDLGIFNLRA